MSEVEMPQEQPTEEPATEESTTEETTEEKSEEEKIFGSPSDLSDEDKESLQTHGFDISTAPEPQPYPAPPDIYEKAPESGDATDA